MGKKARSKLSREDRSRSRERRERAMSLGLPTAAPVASRRVHLPGPESEAIAPDTEFSPESLPRPRTERSLLERLRAVPWQIQSLVAGIVLLVGVGLYRRYTESSVEADATPTQATDATSVVGTSPETSLQSPPVLTAATASPSLPESTVKLQGEPTTAVEVSKGPSVQAAPRGASPKSPKGRVVTAAVVATPKTQTDAEAKAPVASPDNPY